MKKLKKTKILLSFVLILLSFLMVKIENVDAARVDTWLNDAKYTRGVSNTCYYISPSASQYTTSIRQRAYNWENTGWGNTIYMNQVSTDYATHMDIYAHSSHPNLPNGIVGVTMFYNINADPVSFNNMGPEVNYYYANIILKDTDVPTDDRYGTIAHEMGHAFGLRHVEYSKDRLMWPRTDRTRQVPLKEENDVIQYLY